MNQNQTKFAIACALTLSGVLLGAIVSTGGLSDPAPSASEKASVSVSGGTLRIGVESTKPSYYEVDGVAKGFDYEMALGVAEGMGVEPEFVELEFNELFPALKEGKIDMIGAQVSKTSELELEFDFSVSYFSTYVAILTPEGSAIHSRGDINGSNIVVVDGAVHEHYLQNQYEDVKIIKATDAASAVKAIESGEADAFFYGAPYAKSIIDDAPIPLKEPIIYQAEHAPIGFVVRGGDQRKEQIDEVLEEMIRSGEWLRIKTEYFGADRLSEVFHERGR
ncbi:transporter substrate-binding domain-containing protein [Nocardioides sp. NPDC000445]|uniref:substrate-binding periplasmic protein n=1 Tax=Nocardioides sp. NPDC000445 TaxID=3154257 RepID=UPI0033244853